MRIQHDLDHSALGEQEIPMTSSEFQGALPHDMRVNSASSSSREDQPQDLQMTGATREDGVVERHCVGLNAIEIITIGKLDRDAVCDDES